MKKSLIAVAGASVAAAAMPVMGVFAATTTTSFTDVVKVSVGSSCTIIPAGGAVVTETTDQAGNRTITLPDREFGPYTLMQGHSISNIGGSQIAEDNAADPADGQGAAPSAATIVCSAGAGAAEPGSDEQAANSWVLNAQGTEGVTTMTSGSNTIGTGADWTVNSSLWQFRVAGTSGAAANYTAIPDTALRVAESSTTTGAEVTISPRYRVKAAANQAEGTYTGKVTYTLIYKAQ